MEFEDIVNIVAWKYGREKSKEDREDFAQQGWLALTKKKKDLEGLTPAEARRLAYIICRNAVIDLARRERYEVSLDDSNVSAEVNLKKPCYLDVDTQLDCDILIQKLDSLPNPYKDVLKRHFGIHRSQEGLESIAKRYDVSSKTIKRWEEKAILMLKRRMK